MSDKEAKKKEKADQKAAAKALKKADKEKKKEQLLLEKERKKRAGFFAAKRSSTTNFTNNNAPASGGKPLSALERALMSRPGEQELVAKGVIKATRNIPVFGVPLPHVMYITYTQFQLPLPVLHACEFLRSGNGHHLMTEGIFRVPGSAEEVNSFKAKYNLGEDPKFSESHVHSVASMLKLYFRELPEPLCTYKGYQLFCDSQREPDAEQGKVMLMAALAALPPVNRALFATVTRLLKDVAAHEKLNFMSPDNLGIVWGPTLLREEKENFMSMDLPVSVIISLIKYCDEIFVGEEKLELKAASQAIILHTAPSHTAAEMSDSSGSLSVSSMPRSPATPDMLGSGTQEIHHPHPLPQPPPFPRLPSDFGVGIRSPDSGGADSDRTGVRPGFGKMPGRSSSFSSRHGDSCPLPAVGSGSFPLPRSDSPGPTEPPARIYTPPMVPGGLAAAVARRTSDIEGTPTPLRVGIGMSTPPRRALGSRREYSENDLP